jgi:hypothetical protein
MQELEVDAIAGRVGGNVVPGERGPGGRERKAKQDEWIYK